MATQPGGIALRSVCLLLFLTTGRVTSASNDVTITATPGSIYAGLTKQLTINCSFATGAGSDFAHLTSLIISRTLPGATVMREVATLTSVDKDKVVVNDPTTGATMSGHLADHGTAFISLQWTYPDRSVDGEYMCDAFGMDLSGHPRVSEASTEVVAEVDATTSILLAEIKEMHKSQVELKTQFSEFKSNVTSRLDGAMAAMISNSSSFGGHLYLLSKPTLRDISKSDALCRLFGGYLVEINSQAEYDFVWDFAVVNNGVQSLILGASDRDTEGTWTFLHSGRPVVFHKQGDGLTGGDANDCMEIWPEYHGFVDEPCYGINHKGKYEGIFLCEIDN